MMNYDELYRELERDAREAGLEKEHLEWQLGLEGWAKDPVAVAMRDWRLQHAPETLEGKSEERSRAGRPPRRRGCGPRRAPRQKTRSRRRR